MKRVLSIIGMVLAYVLFFFGLIIIAPFAIVIIIFFHLSEFYEKLWQKKRHDPQADLTIKKLDDENWMEVRSKDGYVDAFHRVSGTIAELSLAKKSKTEYEGFHIFNEPDKDIGWSKLQMRQTLMSKHAEIRLVYNFGADTDDDTGELWVRGDDYDERNGETFPAIDVEVISPKLHTKRKFRTNTYNDVWAIAALLRGDIKFMGHQGQLWAYIKEHKVWLVQYRVNQTDYGLRAKSTNAVAYKYRHDKIKPTNESSYM